MQPDRWKTIEETFHAALQVRPQERGSYLDEICAGDLELRREVESLLSESSQSVEFMETPAQGLSLLSLEEESLEGRALNHYLIGPMVDSGGMADVYRARDTKLQRDVAIKVVRDAEFMDKQRLERMYREARLLATLNHPNVGSIYGIEEADGICGLVLEFIEGETLSECIARGALSVPETLAIARQMAAGLQAAHEKGIIHRDLKPSNIKLTRERTVKIIDFGIAKLLRTPDDPGTLTDFSGLGLVIGTLAYMSPEQARGKPIDGRTDIWGFGCLLYEMLSGKPAFQGETPSDVIIKIASEEPDWNRIPRFPETVSHDLERLIRKCIQKDPDRRYQSVRDLANELEAIQEARLTLNDPGTARDLASDESFVLPIQSAPLIFVLAQLGYMALYIAAMYHDEAIARILDDAFQIPEQAGLIGTMVLAACGIAVRIYLLSAVGWRHPAAGRKFALLFPLLLVLDGLWAASPLLLWRKLGFGLALTGVALLAYVPFAQRTLIRSIYPKRSHDS